MSKNRTGTVLALAAATMFASGVLVAPIAAAADATEKACTDAGGKVTKA